MSQKTANQRPVRPRVSGGIPWWLWGLLIVLGGSIAFSIAFKSIPEDPEKLFTEGLAASELQSAEPLQEIIAKLQEFPKYASQSRLLEGISMLKASRPLAAIPILKSVAEEASATDKTLRAIALRFLGAAYAQADECQKAIDTFETMLSEDANSDLAEIGLATIYTQIFAWEEALRHLDILCERNFRAGPVHDMRGDIRMNLGNPSEAAADFEAAINADPVDPQNGARASKLVNCLMETGDLAKASEYSDAIDQPTLRNLLRAELLASQGDIQGAISALDQGLIDTPGNIVVQIARARAILQYDSPIKATEALVELKPVLGNASRDVKLYEVAAALARLAGEDELAALVQQNLDQLKAMEEEFEARFREVIRTEQDADARLELADMAHGIGRTELAFKIYSGLMTYYPDREGELKSRQLKLFEPLPQLVSTATSADANSPEKSN